MHTQKPAWFTTFFFLLIALVFFGCEYKPSLEFDRGIARPDSGHISVTLSPEESSYYFYESTTMNYDLRVFGLPVYSVVFFLGEDKIRESVDTTGSLYFEWNYSTLGSYILTMIVTTGSRSGSLADLLHAEGFVFTRSWEINMVKADPPQPCEITAIKDTAGTVLIRWKADHGKAFKVYYIFRATSVNGSSGNDYLVSTVTQQDSTWCFDSTYIGGTSYYKVKVMNSGGYANSYYYQHETNLSKLKATWLGDNLIKLTWTSSIFYRNFDSYSISLDEAGGAMIYSSDSITSSSFVYSGGIFGGENKFVIHYLAKKQSWMLDDQNESKAGVNVGQSFPAFESFLNTGNGNTVFLLNQYVLKKVNCATGQLQGSMSLPYGTSWCSLSPAGNLMFFPSSFSGYYQIDPMAFSGYEKVDLSNNASPCMKTTLSGTCTGMAHFDFPNNGYMVYDFLNKTMVFSKITDSITCGRISQDGNYIVTGFWSGSSTKCYRILQGNFILQWMNEATPVDFVSATGEVVLFNSATGEVNLRNVSSGQLSHTFTVAATHKYQDTDPMNPFMLFTTGTGNMNNRKIEVYNYLNGTKVFERIALNASWVTFAIQDSVIFSGAGFKLKMQ